MDRFKEFLRTKGLYIAIGTGVLAFVGLMVIYNYNTYKSEFGVDKPAVDLNTPEITETTEQVAETKVEPPETAEANSGDAVAGNTDAQLTDSGNAEESNNQATEAGSAQSEEKQNAGDSDVQNTDAENSSEQAESSNTEMAETSSDGVIVNEDGIVVANAYNEGGTLVWPVEGKVILPYSMDTTVYFKTLRSYRCNPGILIAAEEGENVLSAYEGVVESVSEDKEHGTTVTVIMGNGFKAVYGQLMNVTVAEGDTITTAQNIGEVAPPSSYYTEEGTHVFFELMKNGVPINPMILMQ
ncbi:peptidoglycan DD-metalloendopeptidase family protein [Eubacterium sp. MSJ-21]|nr:peptidoglycan DD-metalloendopeptidase family protein [Eubacterium sp. MSJ-21]